MPREDVSFPTEDGEILEPGKLWFDFSATNDTYYPELATLLPEFADLAERTEVCPPRAKFTGAAAYFLLGEARRVEICVYF